MSVLEITVEWSRHDHVMVDPKLQLSDTIIKNLNRAIVWWEVLHKKSSPTIYVSSLYPKDFVNAKDFGPNANEKLRGMWDKTKNAIILLANIQTLHPQILVSLLFHELGHSLRGHSSRSDRPPSLREEREAERIAVEDYIAYFGKGSVVPRDPRLGDGFYRSLGLRKIERRSPKESVFEL